MKTSTLQLITIVFFLFGSSCQKSETTKEDKDSTSSKSTTVKIEAKGKGTYNFLGKWERKGSMIDYMGSNIGNNITINSSWETTGDLEKEERWQISFTEIENDPSASIEVKVYYNGKEHRKGTITGAKSSLSWQETIQ